MNAIQFSTASARINERNITLAPAHRYATTTKWRREVFIAEAVRRAEAAGYYPAELQRAVDWDTVIEWAHRVQEPGFAWRLADPWSVDAIVVGPGPEGCRAIHSGQHRILGGLMGGNPVPETHLCALSIADRTRGWQEAERVCDDILALLAL